MGLFGKKEKGVDTEETKKVSKKKQRGGKKQKQAKSYIARMALDETVAATAIDEVRMFAEDGEPCIKEVNSGYTAIVITNDMLEESGVDVRSSDFGSFANAITSNTIATVLLEQDLARDLICILPSDETVDILDDYSFIRGGSEHEPMQFNWCIIPHDITDESQVIISPSKVTLSKLRETIDTSFHVYEGDDYRIGIEDGTGEYDATSSVDEVAEEDDVDVVEYDDDDEDDYAGDDDIVSEYDDDNDYAEEPDNVASDDVIAMEPRYDDEFETMSDTQDDDEFDDDDFQPIELDDDANDVYGNPVYSSKETDERIKDVLTREFYSDDLGIELNEDMFKVQFDGSIYQPILFDVTDDADNDLDRNVLRIKKTANTEIQKLHQMHYQTLYKAYNDGMADYFTKMTAKLDYTDKTTAYGQKNKDIIDDYNDLIASADEEVSKARRSKEDEYEQARRDAGEAAKQDAMRKYDTIHKKAYEKDRQIVHDKYIADAELLKDKSIADMYEERQQVAARLMDSGTTTILESLSNAHKKMVQDELAVYDKFRLDIEDYIKNTYSDEIMKAKALTLELERHHEANEVKKEYDLKLQSKHDELLAAKQDADLRLADFKREANDKVQNLIKEHEDALAKRKGDLDSLRETNEKLQQSIMDLDAKKDEEYKHRMNLANDQLKAQATQLASADSIMARQGKLHMTIIAGVAVAMLAVGILGGFFAYAKYDYSRRYNVDITAPADVQIDETGNYGTMIETEVDTQLEDKSDIPELDVDLDIVEVEDGIELEVKDSDAKGEAISTDEEVKTDDDLSLTEGSIEAMPPKAEN